jgi:hypothetical protein
MIDLTPSRKKKGFIVKEENYPFGERLWALWI